MNIIGKMLVIFNLIFALAVGGFLVIDVATRQNWKKVVEALQRELKVVRTDNDMMVAKLEKLNTQVKDAQSERDRAEEKLVLDIGIMKTKLDAATADTQTERGKSIQADARSQELLGSSTRLNLENKDLHELLKKKDEVILGMETDIKTYRQEAFYHLGIAKSMQTRNEELLKQNRELIRKVAEKEATPLASAVVKDPNQPNPPPAKVKGVIELVNFQEGRPTLAQVSLGSDQGLSEGHTLDVYRLSPKATYLGTLRLVDVQLHKSVGQIIEGGFAAGRPRIQIGDQVASEIGLGQK